MKFFAFSLVRAEWYDFKNSRLYQMEWLQNQGFAVVEHHPVTGQTVEQEVAWFQSHIEKNEIPSDGLVLIYDDIAYGLSLGATAKFPRDSIAFKWADEMREKMCIRDSSYTVTVKRGSIRPICSGHFSLLMCWKK